VPLLALGVANVHPEPLKSWGCTGLRFIRFPLMKAPGVRRGSPDPDGVRLVFGAGLPTPMECLTEGLPRSPKALASEVFVLSEPTQKEGNLRSGTPAGSGDHCDEHLALA
jgi:hypothetical protein